MKRIAVTAIALSLLSASVAMAKDHRDSHQDRRNWTSQYQHSTSRDERSNRDRRNHDYDRRDSRHGRYDRFRANEYRRPAGYRDYRWRRGERLPRAYYARPYVLGNYGHYRLQRPPRGYDWVRVNHDVVLTALATGLVLDVMYDYFW